MAWTKEQHRDYMRDYMRKLRGRGLESGPSASSWERRMGRRGRKPIDIRLLNVWEFEWYKAFHLLRYGTQLPAGSAPTPALEQEIEGEIERLDDATINQLWAEHRHQGALPRTLDPLTSPQRDWIERERWAKIAELWRQLPTEKRVRMLIAVRQRKLPEEAGLRKEALAQIAELKRFLLKNIHALDRRHDIWKDLTGARTIDTVQTACRRWERLPDVSGGGYACFPAHVSVNAKQFLAMKQNKRFARSKYADDSRLEYLARGMAGVMVGKSPLTAIERLRNMKHDPDSPCWDDSEQSCQCWRCVLTRWREMEQFLQNVLEKENTAPSVEQRVVIESKPEEPQLPIHGAFCCPSCGTLIPHEVTASEKLQWTIVCSQCASLHQQDPVRNPYDGTFRAALAQSQKGESL